jgi:hypothetical protein
MMMKIHLLTKKQKKLLMNYKGRMLPGLSPQVLFTIKGKTQFLLLEVKMLGLMPILLASVSINLVQIKGI